MTIAQLKDKLQTGSWSSEEERKSAIADLLKNHFTPVSANTVLNFQAGWDGTRPFSEFKEGQDKALLECVQLEQSGLGEMVRETFNRGPLTDEMEV